MNSTENARQPLARWTWAAMMWLAAWAVLRILDGDVALGHLALVPVLAAALSGLRLRLWESVIVCTVATIAFNWQFVPPRGTLSVDLHQDALLLLALWSVGSLVAGLMGRQRSLLWKARQLARQAELLRTFNDDLHGLDID